MFALPRKRDYGSPRKWYCKILRTGNGGNRIATHILAMNVNASPSAFEIRSYTQLQRQIHDDLRAQHPEWVEPNGECPTCESYESRLAELLGLSSPGEHRAVA
jgi:hypothetical protein